MFERTLINPEYSIEITSKEKRMMMVQIRKLTLALLLPGFVLIGLWGCGDDHNETGTDALSRLEPGIQALDNRLQTHYETVTGILNSAGAGNASTRGRTLGASTDTQELGLMNEDWEAIHREREDYGQDMHRMLNDLGDTVSMVGDCQMMMGGMMFGNQHAADTCPCEPYMDVTDEEVDQHMSEMLDWMNQQNPSGLWEEMDRHWEQLKSDIQNLHSHMRQTYRAHGGMM
ncbi:MAG: hypothetical protein ACWGQW_11660 [bacterium]